MEKRRYDRIAQLRHRNGKRSYVTEIENLKILLAWEHGDLTEGQAAKALQVDRMDARQMIWDAIEEGNKLAR